MAMQLGSHNLLNPRLVGEKTTDFERTRVEDLIFCHDSKTEQAQQMGKKEEMYLQYTNFVIKANHNKDRRDFRFLMLEKETKTILQFWLVDGLEYPQLARSCSADVWVDILTQQLPCPPMKIAKTSELAVNDHAIETLQCGAKYNIADFTFSKIVASQRVKLPGSIPNGMPFTIEDCKDAQLFVMDITAQTTVDSCINTFIFIGPCEGSVFIRDCTNCTIVCAAHQLRLRGCQNIKLVLYVATQPVIETSSEIQFSCFRYAYSQLKDQFRSAKLDVLSNFWCDVFDFNDITSKNYTIVDILNNTADVTMAVPSDEPILDVDITYKTCPVPLTEHMTNDTLASVNNDNIVLIAATFLNAHNIIEEYIDIAATPKSVENAKWLSVGI
ncbi:hypothetical protein BASA60_006248 [Batrachochytrium salamandrivorans]|nr:hypothetical protein BASA60_006248 [Batrachochytrium salamandrivorans]